MQLNIIRTKDINAIAGRAALIRSNAEVSIGKLPIIGRITTMAALSDSHIGAGREPIWSLRYCHIAAESQ
jgi:hypothetical protein